MKPPAKLFGFILLFSLLIFAVPGRILAANYGEGSYGEGVYNVGETPTPAPTSAPSVSSASGSAPESCTETVPTGPSPWLNLAYAESSRSITLKFVSWQSPVTHFALEYGTVSNSYEHAVSNIGGSVSTSYTVGSLLPNTTYYFRVRAGNGCATGSWSNELSATTYIPIETGRLNIVDIKLENIDVVSQCTNYEVVSGDSLWNIAQSLLGDGSKYQKIADKNADKYPALKTSPNLTVGWELAVACDKEEAVSEGYNVEIKILDENEKPLDGVEVTIYSEPKTATTDKDGIAHFENIEAGDHKIQISYGNYEGEQSINLAGEEKEVGLTITVKPKNVLFDPKVLGITGVLLLTIMVLSLKLISLQKKSRNGNIKS